MVEPKTSLHVIALAIAVYHKALLDYGVPCALADDLVRDWHQCYLAELSGQFGLAAPIKTEDDFIKKAFESL